MKKSKKSFLTDLSQLLNPFLDSRIEQVLLEVERNPGEYPEHAEHYHAYRETRDEFEQDYPSLENRIDELVSTIDIRYSDMMREVYRQGAYDCVELLSRLSGRKKREEVAE